ncbi:hypothetical protein PENTCL1PPCAC_16336, partial [Pristionchus entomophagus]
SLVVLAVCAAQGSRPTGRPFGTHRPHGGKHVSHSPPTEKEKKKFEEAFDEKVAKLSPEAQEVAKKIKAVLKEKKGERKEVEKAIEEITAPLSESVKKEM